MPRVTEAHRQARRQQIAQAALRVLRRNGIADTSLAAIAEESGLSIGAIYVNFENKADLARYVAHELFAWRIETLEVLADSGAIHPPLEVLRALLTAIAEEDRPPLPVILQFWSETVVDADLHAVLVEQIERLRTSVQQALLPWAAAQPAADDAVGLAHRTAKACLIMAQGYLANRTLLGWMSAQEYLASVATAFGQPDPIQPDHRPAAPTSA